MLIYRLTQYSKKIQTNVVGVVFFLFELNSQIFTDSYISIISLWGLFKLKMSHQNEDVLQASHVELLHHLWEVSETPGVKGEYPALVCIIQIIPLHILVVQKCKIISENQIIKGEV